MSTGSSFACGPGSLEINEQVADMVRGQSVGILAQTVTLQTTKLGLVYLEIITPGFRTLEIPLVDVTLGVPGIERVLTVNGTARKILIG